MHLRLAECANVRNAGTGRQEGVGHDRAIAAEFVHAGKELDVSALAGRSDNALTKFRQGGNRCKILALAATKTDGSDDGIDEAVKTDDGGLGAEAGAVGLEFLEGAGTKHK